MDDTDRKILVLLQEEGRLTVRELADRVQLNVSPCHRRLRDLERTGVITGYHAAVNPAAVGLAFQTLVFVTLHHVDQDTVTAFEEALPAIPQIRRAQRLFSTPGYLLDIITTDLTAFQHLYTAQLADLPGVQRLIATPVVKQVVHERPLPM